MKTKMITIIMVTLLLASMLSIVSIQPVMAHTECDPFITDLIADGGDPSTAVDVGDVLVWNDADYLYVKFETINGWVMTETHLHIFQDDVGFTDIPHNNGNPIPGLFQYKHEDLGGITNDPYDPISLSDLGVGPCDDLYIAAHAVVIHPEQTCIVSDLGTMVTLRRSGDEAEFTSVNAPAVYAWEPGPNYPNDDPSDDSGWEANSLWDQQIGAYHTLFDSLGADWIWESYNVLDPVYGTVLQFERPFEIGYPIGGTLTITCDNGYEAFVNGLSVGSAQVNGDWRLSNLKQDYVDVAGWQSVEQYDVSGFLQSGTNTLTIDAANEYFDTDDYGNPSPGTKSNNPAGLIFALCVDYYREETAWGDGEDFPGKNWATYFSYHVQGEIVEEYPETGNVYIGYEDWPDGDFDYNDFGMKFSVVETYWGSPGNLYLTIVTMTFEAVIYDSGMDHLIHIKRPINGPRTVTVTRPNPRPSAGPILGKDETPAGTYSGTGDVDVILFNTNKYTHPEKQIGEVVIVDIVVGDPSQNPKVTLTPPRVFTNEALSPFYDLDAIMTSYDPWEEGTLYGSLYHIHTIQSTFKFGSPAIDVPYILVAPYTDWIPPWESTIITGPYGYFDDFYRYGTPINWYEPSMVTNNIVGSGGLSWGPYP